MAERLTIALDAMGGDNAPRSVLRGANIARKRFPNVDFLLVGDEAKLAPMLKRMPKLKRAVTLVHAPDKVGADDKAAQALRSGRNSSMRIAIDQVREGKAQGLVSAGNTGALMAMSKFQLRPLDGIARPAIAALWPTMHGQSVVLDVGANVGSEARHLVDFGVMGAAFARAVFGLKTPSVGLLNIGSEEVKGNEQVKAAAQTLRDAGLDIAFAGFVEGDDISAGTVDVVVTDGFTGNIALKAAEGTAKLVSFYLREALKRSLLTKIGAFLAGGAFRVLKARMDPRSVNGGVFLGLNGIVVKSHGGTDGIGFAAAIDMAVDMAKQNMVQRIADDIRGVSGVLSRIAPAAPDEPAPEAAPPA